MEEEGNITDRIINFLNTIGIRVTEGPMPEGKEVLPGIAIVKGSIIIDKKNLIYPGDILHEAAHIAVTVPEKRNLLEGFLETDTDESRGEEIMSIPWSYAAALHLGIDPKIVFHEGGYKGGSESILENFAEGRYIGVSLLQWIGLTYESVSANGNNVAPFPHMVKWLRESVD